MAQMKIELTEPAHVELRIGKGTIERSYEAGAHSAKDEGDREAFARLLELGAATVAKPVRKTPESTETLREE